MAAIKDIGCIVCLVTIGKTRPCDVHHFTSGFRRHGHQQTIGLCSWHHRGVKEDGWSRQAMSGLLGPSLTMGRRTFENDYGPESELIAVQDLLLELFAHSPWIDYNPPIDARRKAMDLWTNGRK